MAKAATKKNKLGVKNSLVNNINAKKKKGTSKPKKKSTISPGAYEAMEHNWNKPVKKAAKKNTAKKAAKKAVRKKTATKK